MHITRDRKMRLKNRNEKSGNIHYQLTTLNRHNNIERSKTDRLTYTRFHVKLRPITSQNTYRGQKIALQVHESKIKDGTLNAER